MNKPAIFVAATGQHVGKTTCCLGLLAGLQQRFTQLGFIKPVGQEHVIIEDDLPIDKDVVLFKRCFDLPFSLKKMSPVIFARTFTRDYLDGKYDMTVFRREILSSYQEIEQTSDCMLVEGTGHVGVGDIVDLNNVQVAKLLKLRILIVAPGGLGSTFDSLALNIQMCRAHNVEVAGIILNKVIPEKIETVKKYMQRALDRWNIPLLGIIPYHPFLSMPCMKDFELIFTAQLISGDNHRLRHFKKFRLVATSVSHYEKLICKGQLVITPATRDDIIKATLKKHWDLKLNHDEDLANGFILTGSHPPKASLIKEIIEADIPMLYAPVNSFNAMKKITSYTAKIRTQDQEKIRRAIDVVTKHIDFIQIQTLMEKDSNP